MKAVTTAGEHTHKTRVNNKQEQQHKVMNETQTGDGMGLGSFESLLASLGIEGSQVLDEPLL